ncbi:hypothetical protein BC941DRAFT_409468 [Chlamydoabsidia padenii]|nr:hypothetical protein BC941DRAFT_409468 [Chlamydoabsidia padenii]
MKNKGVSLLAKGVATCPAQATAYGKCVAINYKDAHMDMCAKEFQAFKQCVEKVAKRKW